MIYAKLTGGSPCVTSEASLVLPGPQLSLCKVGGRFKPFHTSLGARCVSAPAEGCWDPRKIQSQRTPTSGWEYIASVLGRMEGYFLAHLPTPSSVLVLAFRGAHRKQEEQRRKLEQQVALMETRQAEELAALEATARALGRARRPCHPPRPGETFL